MPMRRDKWIQSEVVMARDAHIKGMPNDATLSVILYSIVQQVKYNCATSEAQRSRMIELAALLMIEVEQIDKKEGRK